jgi:hypothetical protein
MMMYDDVCDVCDLNSVPLVCVGFPFVLVLLSFSSGFVRFSNTEKKTEFPRR